MALDYVKIKELRDQGLTLAKIAEQLSISPKTVARHRENIMGKLNLHSRSGSRQMKMNTT